MVGEAPRAGTEVGGTGPSAMAASVREGVPLLTPEESVGSSSPLTPTASPPPTRMLSWSQLNQWLMCGEMYRLSRIEQVPSIPSGGFIGGRVVHSAIEHAERHGCWVDLEPFRGGHVEELFYDDFDKLVVEAGGPEAVRWGGALSKQTNTREDHNWWHGNGPMMLRRWRTWRVAVAEVGYELIDAEIAVGMELPDGTYVRGYIDAFSYVDANGEFLLIDYKSGSGRDSLNLQLPIYRLALLRSGVADVRRGLLMYLRSSNPDTMLVPINLDPAVDPVVDRSFAEFIRALDSGIFPLNPSNFCKSCSVRLSCDYGKTIVDPAAPAVLPAPVLIIRATTS